MKKEIKNMTAQQAAEKFGIVYLDLRYDYAFKRAFGTVGNEDLLLMLIQAILPEKNITSVSLRNQEQMGDRPDSRKSVYDVCCTTDNGSIINVEMQLGEQDDFANRMIYYSTYPIRNQIQSGCISFDLNPVYVIGILDFILPNVPENKEVINHYTVCNSKGIQFSDNIHYLTVELPKFNKSIEQLDCLRDKVLFLLGHMGELKSKPKKIKGENFDKLFQVTKFAAMENEDQMEYVHQMMAEIDAKSRLRTAKRKAIAEGREEGLAKGLAEGRAEGLAKGREEKATEIARNMKAKGLPVNQIAEFTGLTAEEIESLQ